MQKIMKIQCIYVFNLLKYFWVSFFLVNPSTRFSQKNIWVVLSLYTTVTSQKKSGKFDAITSISWKTSFKSVLAQ